MTDRATSPGGAPPPAPQEVDDASAKVDPYGRIVVTLRKRSGRVVGCFAVPAGRAAVLAREIIGRPSDPATSAHPTTLPPPPEAPVEVSGGWTAIGLPRAEPAPRWVAPAVVLLMVAIALVGWLTRPTGIEPVPVEAPASTMTPAGWEAP